ncbi:MAG TPA: class II aldolase/adducin family protein [Bacteroidales bacterium]|nr:class II aldolase/adducin family protein [Bacteroidales bacterium]
MNKEAYNGVKFETVFINNAAPQNPLLEELKKWCSIFHEKGLAPPYPGGSYGNLSFRIQGHMFMITGTCIGLKNTLDDSCFTEVVSCDPEKKEISVKGSRAPSSESFMHDLIYRNRPDVHAVFHGHNALITQHAAALGIPETLEKTSYGTVELAESVLKILDQNTFIVIKDHGFVSMAGSMQQAGDEALRWLEKVKLL